MMGGGGGAGEERLIVKNLSDVVYGLTLELTCRARPRC
jgi:hypothetical protein